MVAGTFSLRVGKFTQDSKKELPESPTPVTAGESIMSRVQVKELVSLSKVAVTVIV